MKGQITTIQTHVINGEIHVIFRFEGIITINEHNDITNTFEVFRQEGNEYQIETSKKYTLIKRINNESPQ